MPETVTNFNTEYNTEYSVSAESSVYTTRQPDSASVEIPSFLLILIVNCGGHARL